MVYFDNAATTFPKPRCVLDEVNRCIRDYCGNPGRSGHRLSALSAEKIYEVRERLAEHFGSDRPENIVFTYNATYALNIAIRTLIPDGAHVLCSDIEHNSVVRPLYLMKREGKIDFSLFSTSGDIEKNIESEITDKTIAIVSTLSSNVTGKIVPIEILSRISKKHGLILIADASQSAGHERFNLKRTPCDALCAPGHKGLFGIQGSGFIIFGKNSLPPFLVGGSGTDSKSPKMPKALPESHEAGTLSTPSIISLGSGVDFIEKVGIDEIIFKEKILTEKIKSGLSVIPKIELYKTDGSIVLFNSKAIKESSLCARLDEYGIYVRGGFHCAPSAHKGLGTETSGAVRISVSYFNAENEVEYFLKSVEKITAEI